MCGQTETKYILHQQGECQHLFWERCMLQILMTGTTKPMHLKDMFLSKIFLKPASIFLCHFWFLFLFVFVYFSLFCISVSLYLSLFLCLHLFVSFLPPPVLIDVRHLSGYMIKDCVRGL